VSSRRNLLKGALALLLVRDALAQGRVEKGLYRVRGDVRVNGEPAKEGGQVGAGDSIATGANGEIVFVVGRDAMLVGDAAARETVRTTHHEQPRYVMATGAPQMILRAPVLNHNDAELILLESLVGRQPPFIGRGVRPY
jgi:hypothetical protein